MKASRRDLIRYLALGGASLLASPLLLDLFRAQGLYAQARSAGLTTPTADKGAVTSWARLRFRCTNNDPDDWKAHPNGDLNLIQRLNENTTLSLSEKWNIADVAKLEEMIKFPLLFMHAEVQCDLTAQEKKNLREYLLRGGFLYAEDCVCGLNHHGLGVGPNDFFFSSIKTVLTDLFPEGQVQKIPLDHDVFHCFFDLPDGQPHMQGVEHGAHGLFVKQRLLAYLSPSDAHCGWTAVRFFGPEKSQQCIQIGTNVYLYAMTH